MTKGFIAGLTLNRQFFDEVVVPILAREFPLLSYSAARLGYGSEVLGYDTPMSMDHDWGVKMHLFVSEADEAAYATAVVDCLRQQLPTTFMGISTHFSDPHEDDSQGLVAIDAGPVNHNIQVMTLATFMQDYIGFGPDFVLTTVDWLTIPQQLLLGMTKGAVFADPWGELAAIRQKLAYYPQDVWLYLLAAQWARIGQEEHFLGRTGIVGDELGSRLIGARLVHDVMQLCFLMERVYAPYPKWFGTAFAQLSCAATLTPLLQAVLSADTWQARERPLGAAYEFVAEMHNGLAITPPLATSVQPFYGRPFQVIVAGRFVDAIMRVITDNTIKGVGNMIGSIDQFSHSTDLRENRQIHRRLRLLYERDR